MTGLDLLGAWINWPLPTYIPTWPTGADVVLKNTKSPACKSDLLTALPLLDCSKEVLGIDMPICLWHQYVTFSYFTGFLSCYSL